MDDLTHLEKRISDLEHHITHQDAVIQDLSDMTAQQWEVIDALTKKHDRLSAHLATIEESVDASTPQDPPPPHY